MAFLTVGIQYALCTDVDRTSSPALNPDTLLPIRYFYGVTVREFEYEFSGMQKILSTVSNNGINLTADWHGQDLSGLFIARPDYCLQYGVPQSCSLPNPVVPTSPGLPGYDQPCPSSKVLGAVRRRRLFVTWEQIASTQQPLNHLVAYNGMVLNLTNYFAVDKQFLGPSLTALLKDDRGKDITLNAVTNTALHQAIPCLTQKYTIASLGKEPSSCIVKDIILVVTLFIVIAVLFTKFIMAVIFHWVLSWNLIGSPKKTKPSKSQKRQSVSRTPTPVLPVSLPQMESDTPQSESFSAQSTKQSSKKMDVIIMVTCFSESKKQVKASLDSVVEDKYPNENKLLFVICDGIVTGANNSRTTAEIILRLMDVHEKSQLPKAMAYISLEEDKKQINRAMVVCLLAVMLN
jgi:chitin synthase